MENTEWALALNGIFSGRDVSFYWANIYNDLPHAERDSDAPAPTVHLVHERIAMVGAAYNQALGNWLLKTELPGSTVCGTRPPATKPSNRLDVLIGADTPVFPKPPSAWNWPTAISSTSTGALPPLRTMPWRMSSNPLYALPGILPTIPSP